MCRRLAAVVLAIAVVVGAPGPLASTAPTGAQEPTATTTTLPPAPDIIPRPDQGVAPQDAGDRGGALQATLFFLVIGGVGVIALLVVRESRRARAGRT